MQITSDGEDELTPEIYIPSTNKTTGEDTLLCMVTYLQTLSHGPLLTFCTPVQELTRT